jgi:hypothetical protein
MTAIHSRRSIVTGLAAAPVLGLPAIAAASAEPDPIFEAIRRHEAAWHVHIAASLAEDEADPEGTAHRVDPGVTYGGFRVLDRAELDRLRDKHVRWVDAGAPGYTLARVEADYQRACAEFEANNAAHAEWQKSTREGRLQAARHAAEEEEDAAAEALATIVPTTIAGAVALLEYVNRFDESKITSGREGWTSEYRQWPDTLRDEELIGAYGRPLTMPFHCWVVRNVALALRGAQA